MLEGCKKTNMCDLSQPNVALLEIYSILLITKNF